MNRFPTIPAGAIATITHTRPADPTPIEIHDGDTAPDTPEPETCDCRARRQKRGSEWGWDTNAGSWYGDDSMHVTQARVCAVVDPDNPHERDDLADVFARYGWDEIDSDVLATVLADFTAPPIPDPGEPADAGPYLDRAGLRWFRRATAEWITIDDLTLAPVTWPALWDERGPITPAMPEQPTGGAA